MGHQRLPCPGLPLQTHDLTGPWTTEDAYMEQAEVVNILDGPNERQNLSPRDHGPFSRLGLRHGHVFSRVLGQKLLLLGHVGNHRVLVKQRRTVACEYSLSTMPFSQT